MIRNTTKNQKLGWVFFIVYLILLVYFMFFAESFGRTSPQEGYAYNLELFKEIKRFWTYRQQLGFSAVFLNLAGNVIGFVPCGFFLPIVSRRSRVFWKAVFLCFLLSLAIETAQLVFKVGSFDVDDLFLNTVGGMLGVVFHRAIQVLRMRRRRNAKG